MAQLVASRLSGLDVLVVSAGIGRSAGALGDDDELWREIFDVNVFGARRVLRSVFPLLRASGAARAIFVSSVNAVEPPVGMAAYNASKAALESMIKTFALELAPYAVTVNGVAPGLVQGVWPMGYSRR